MRAHARTARDTEDFGGALARSHPAADAALAVLYLTGELGAGKTTFARGFLRALGVAEAVPRPPYTLPELYPAGALPLVHLHPSPVPADPAPAPLCPSGWGPTRPVLAT